MKKLILLLLIFFFISCAGYMPLSKINERVYIGMTFSEFKKIVKKRALKDELFDTYYRYRVNQYDLKGKIIDSRFYYFSNGYNKLIKVDNGAN